MHLRSLLRCTKHLALLSAALGPALMFVSASPSFESRDARSRALLNESLAFAENYWDDRAALLWSPTRGAWAYSTTAPEERHIVRETAWFALGVLLRGESGDRERAVRAIDAVLKQQIHAPGEPWDGTFFRNPEEPHPPTGAQRWDDYDPNWRQFIGTTLALLLIEFEDQLPPSIPARIEQALAHAIEGERNENRIHAGYTNIALMHAFLLGYAGQRLERADWLAQADALASEIHERFTAYGAFEEYNSPTYYGIDIYGLALWRKHGPTPRLRALGAMLEAALWQDMARFYHAGLKNFAGPFDRAYGMDLQRYCATIALPIALMVDRADAPLPPVGAPMKQAHDFILAPLHVLLGAAIPPDSLAHFRAFQGEREVVQRITDHRTATAWLSRDLMIGAEATSLQHAAGTPHNQFHPATIHWRLPDNSVAWILLQRASRMNARASAHRLEIEAIGTAVFRVHAPGAEAPNLSKDQWMLPSLSVAIDTDARGFSVAAGAEPNTFDLTYRDATRLELTSRFHGQTTP